jgi:hypothetical protein
MDGDKVITAERDAPMLIPYENRTVDPELLGKGDAGQSRLFSKLLEALTNSGLSLAKRGLSRHSQYLTHLGGKEK